MRLLRAALPPEVPLIGFAGAPWTVATYMIAGRGTPDQGPAHALIYRDPATFEALIDRITAATIEYLSAQVEAGAEVVKLFDSWAGSLPGPRLRPLRPRARPPHRRGAQGAHPGLPVIAFPRGAGAGFDGLRRRPGPTPSPSTTASTPTGRRARCQPGRCVQGNLDPLLLVTGGDALVAATRRVVDAPSPAAPTSSTSATASRPTPTPPMSSFCSAPSAVNLRREAPRLVHAMCMRCAWIVRPGFRR